MELVLKKLELPAGLGAEPTTPKLRVRRAVADAKAFAKFGVQVLRVKAAVLGALGTEAEAAGIKQIGHGRILVASDNADTAISRIDDIIDKLLKAKPPDYPLIADMMRLKKEFNAQVIKSAEAHFSADNRPYAPPPPGGDLHVYPAGAPVMIAVGKQPVGNQPVPVEEPGKPPGPP